MARDFFDRASHFLGSDITELWTAATYSRYREQIYVANNNNCPVIVRIHPHRPRVGDELTITVYNVRTIVSVPLWVHRSNGGWDWDESFNQGRSITLRPGRNSISTGYRVTQSDISETFNALMWGSINTWARGTGPVRATADPVETYTIMFDANGGVNAPNSQTKTHGVDLTLTTDEPTRSDYTFLGWATTADATEPEYQPGDTFSRNADTTLYAVWRHDNNESICPADAIAEGQFESQTGANGITGAIWCLFNDGTLEVHEGFINWEESSSPWFMYNHQIDRIEFTGLITAGSSLTHLFAYLNVATIEGLAYFDTSQVTDMSNMFNVANGLTSLDLSYWDTSNVTRMDAMFFQAENLTELDLSGWDTSQVTDMSSMFGMAISLTTLDMSGWDTSQVTDMTGMFIRVVSLTSLDLSDWDTSNVTRMDAMFFLAGNLTEIDLSNWDTSQVTGMNNMFSGAVSLTSLDLSS